MIFTVGYQALSRVEVLAALAREHNACIVDVRMNGRTRTFHETSVQRVCAVVGVGYLRAPGLGNRNYRDVRAPIVLEDPEQWYARIMREYLDEGRSILLLCACRHFEGCHRTTIAAELAHRSNLSVEHLNPAVECFAISAKSDRQGKLWA